ncbi:CapA family protein [Bacillus horti]|uniref:Poly-gamma-glutamate synthesis protein (Capsule biosynthesis protein) n=1 Tax=Caldalkalibacillus horti TaxID=77523 RepID=A0ABT9VVL1_9BACI|nr:CapA family protein [Bacillus horti]MDQ0164882.1 poly-gamma-glutamate synthesis protein (capsule biosynthesis protein) [Bacillus horti]
MNSNSPNRFNIALTGDSIIARRISMHQDEQTVNLYQKIKEADVAFTNLEVLPNNFVGHPAARSDGAHFAAHSYVLDDLMDIGFNLYSCANNHALDYGVDGLLSTIQELEERQLSYAGIGKNLTEARMPVYHSVSGGTVALLSCTSTFFDEQAAGEQRPEVQGRPGVNPLKFEVEYEVTEKQLHALKEIYQDLGLEEQRQNFVKLGFGSDPTNKKLFPFVDTNLRVAGTMNALFSASDTPKVRTKTSTKDMQDMAKWVKEARARADVVIVSLHAHEQGQVKEQPAEFIREFTHRMIDEGADVVVGHGPHLLKGLEIYKGKPIFYSLGNFIGHNELVFKLPEDSYKRFNVDSTLTPSEIFRLRSDNGRKGFPGNAVYWETIMPICQIKDGRLQSIELHPVSLTRGDTPYKRGRPYLSDAKTGIEIMNRFSALSKEFNTTIHIDETGKGIIHL